MTDEQKLYLFDTQGFNIIELINKKWLKRHLKRHSLVSIDDIWSSEAVVELIDRYLAVESKK